MSAVQRSPSVTTKRRSTFANATVVGTLVAVAVAMLFILSLIAGHASNHTRTAVRTEGRYAPLIQYRGTGQPPAATITHRTPGRRQRLGCAEPSTPTALCRRARGGSRNPPQGGSLQTTLHVVCAESWRLCTQPTQHTSSPAPLAAHLGARTSFRGLHRSKPIEADRGQRRRPHPTPQTRSHSPNPPIQMWITPPPPHPEPTPKSTSSTTRRIDAAARPKPVTMTTTSERQTGSHRFGRWRGPVCSRIRAVFSAILAVLVVSAAAFGGISVRTDDALAADSLHWSTPRVIERGSSSHPVAVAGVSCPSVSLCVGFDSHGAVVSSTDPFGQGPWQVSRIPGRSVLRMTCPSASVCLADTNDFDSLYVSTNPAGGGSTFTATAISPPLAVSCPSASFCVTVDGGGQILTTSDPGGGPAAWTKRTIPGPFGSPIDGFDAVSCASASMCVASFSPRTAGSSEEPGIAVSTDPAGDGSTWTMHALPGKSGVYGSQMILTSLSCPARSLCIGGSLQGSLVTSTDPAAGTWTVEPVSVHWVSCQSPTLCFADGTVLDVNNINKSPFCYID